MRLVWDNNAWEDYLRWQQHEGDVVRRINLLLADIACHPHVGLGAPVPLTFDLTGYWSRRLVDEHRLVYRTTDHEMRIAACRYCVGR